MTAVSSSEPVRENEKTLVLDYECLKSFPDGINDVRLWYDKYLKVQRVDKRIDLGLLPDDGSLREPETLQSIKHPNVLEVLAVARLPQYRKPLEVVEMITPYLERGSITDALLRGERFTLTNAISIAKMSLLGLAELHEVHRIVHRDIKGGNILLSSDATLAKVADLGVAARMDENGEAITANNPTLYSPPEFSTGVVTAVSDIFSMGLVIHELISGPFPYLEYFRADIIERLERGAGGVLAKDLFLPMYVHRTLRRVLKKCCEIKPEKRYRSARDVCSALAKSPVLDWEVIDAQTWEADFRHTKAKRVRVQVTRKHLGGYAATTYTRTQKNWMKKATSTVPSLTSHQLRQVFDNATEAASIR